LPTKNTEIESKSNNFKLDETNYSKWVFAMKMTLSVGVADFAEDPDNIGLDLVTVKKAADFGREIVSNCSETIINELMAYSSGIEMLKHLQERYSGVNPVRRVQGIKNLAQFKCSDTDMCKNVVKIKRLTRETIVANSS
jgi:hypothetical protein